MLSLALFSEAKSAPRTWVPDEPMRVLALFGAARIDLRQLAGYRGDIAISALAMFGEVEITVPPGTLVDDAECFALFGAVDLPRTSTGAGAVEPASLRLQLSALAFCGAVKVRVRENSPFA